jgi:hypothetical protein
MEIKKNRYSFFELGKLGIATVNWEQYHSKSQLVNVDGYKIGAISDWINDSLLDAKDCLTMEKQVTHINYLKFKYGVRSIIIIIPLIKYDETGAIVIRGEKDFDIDGVTTAEERVILSRWVSMLASGYTFESDIYLDWAKSDGRIMVTNIY